MDRLDLFPVVSQGWRLALPFAILALPAAIAGIWLSILFLLLAAGILWFFRDPDRQVPDTGLLSPADGRITVLRRDEGGTRVGVFMNVTDVHVNRAPIRGTITHVEHQPGGHRPAFSKDSEHNERVRIGIEGDRTIEVILIAGAFARRIFPYVRVGQTVERGERIAHIAFGSRVDVRMPPEIALEDVTVEPGQSVRAGESRLVD